MLPTVRTLAIFDSASTPRQRSIARVRARRTRTSSNGFLAWLIVTTLPQFQSLSWTAILSPSAFFNSSRAAGGKPRNSIAAAVAAQRVDPGRLLRRVDADDLVEIGLARLVVVRVAHPA